MKVNGSSLNSSRIPRKKKLAFEIGLITTALALSLSPAVLAQDVSEEAEAGLVEEVFVTGIRRSVLEGLDIKRSSGVIVDAISSEDMGQFPDMNLAEALQRVPEVAIDRSGGEGRFVTIRGLGPEFNAVLLNGRRLATTDRGREFSFDTISTEMVKSMKVYKTQSAVLREGGLGGTVDIITAKPMDYDGLAMQGSLEALYDDNADEWDPQVSFQISNTFADGTVGAMLSVSRQERATRTYQTNTGGIRTEAQFFVSAYAYAYTSGGLGRSYRPIELNRNVVDENRERTGLYGALQFRPSDKLEINVDYLYSAFDVEKTTLQVSNWFWAIDPPASMVDDPLLNLAPWEADRIRANSQTAIDGNGVFTRASHGGVWDSGNSQAYNREDEFRDTETQMLGLNFDYRFSDRSVLNLDAAWSEATTDNPGLNQRRSMEILGQPESVINFAAPVPWIESSPDTLLALPENIPLLRVRRQWDSGNDVDAENYEFGARYDFEFSDSLWLRMGGLYESATKTDDDYRTPNDVQVLYHRGNFFLPTDRADELLDGILEVDSTDFSQPAEANNDIFAINRAAFDAFINDPATAQAVLDQNAGDPATQARYDAFMANGGFQAVLTGNAWEVEEKVTSLFLDADWNFQMGSVFSTLTAGIRYAKTDLDAVGFSQVLTGFEEYPCDSNPALTCLQPIYAPSDGPDGLTTQKLSNSYSDWLPSLNLKMDLTDSLVMRLAASQSLTRPVLEDMAPRFRVGATGVNIRTAKSNNADLTPYTSNNLDASVEWYYKPTSVLAVAAFWKDVDDFIVTEVVDDVVVDTISNPEYQTFSVQMPTNAEAANIYGFSVNWTHYFESGFGFQANYTDIETDKEFDGEVFNQSQVVLPGLSDVFNLVAFYEKGPFAARIAYNWRDQFLISSQFASGYVWGEAFNEARFAAEYDQVDARVSYTWSGLTFSLEAINLTDSEYSEHGRFENLFISHQKFGRRYILGVSGRF
jgi:TonB-dependent receptor